MARAALAAALPAWIAALALGAAPGAAHAVEALHLDHVLPSPDGGSDVLLLLRAEDRLGEPVAELRPDALAIRDDGELVEAGRVRIARLADAEQGVAIAIALDVSRAMQGEAFEGARQASLRLLERLRAQDRLAIVAFSDEVEVVASFRDDPAAARAALEELEVDRRALTSLLHDGAFKAVDMIRRGRDLPARSFVVVFSTGRDEGSRATGPEVVELARADPGEPGSGARIPVFTIGYDRFGGSRVKTLLELSRETAAEAFFAQSADLVPAFFDEIWKQMMHSFVVRFPAQLDGGRHTIEVAIGGQSDLAVARYPDRRPGLLPWAIGGAVVLGLAAVWTLRPGRGHAGHLLFLDGPRKGESVGLGRPQLSLGALPDNDIVVPSEAVSRYHAQIHCRGRYVEIKDVGSRNGTYVNGTAIESCPLEPGDRVRIGDTELVYER